MVQIKRNKGLTIIDIGNELIVTTKLNRYKVRTLEKHMVNFDRKKFKAILNKYLK